MFCKKHLVLFVAVCAIFCFAAKLYAGPLGNAAKQGDLESVKRLLKDGLPINGNPKIDSTPLYRASLSGQFEVAQYLISQGADVNRDSPLAVASRGYLQIVQLLVDKGADIDGSPENYQYPLEAAIKADQPDIVAFLLDKGADVNIKDVEEGFTPLIWASTKGNLMIVEALLTAGADVNHKARYYEQAIHRASRNGHTDVLALLIEKGANIEADVEMDGTPLAQAIRFGHTETAALLINRGADLNNPTYHSGIHAPLVLAIDNVDVEMVELLLEKGTDPNQLYRFTPGRTPLGIAMLLTGNTEKQEKIIELLLSHGASVN